MLNKVELIGHVGRDPEIRSTQSGGNVANFSMATSERWKDRDGNRQERTEWHKVVVFGNLVDVFERYVKKGSKIYVSGKMQTRKWMDQSGQERYTTEVVLTQFKGELVMLDSPGSNGGGSRQGEMDYHQRAEQAERQDQQNSQYTNYSEDLDDEIPF